MAGHLGSRLLRQRIGVDLSKGEKKKKASTPGVLEAYEGFKAYLNALVVLRTG